MDARALSRRFGPKLALSGVSLAVRAGEVHALLGPNGAGKTTLLRILMGLVDPTTGSARILGLDASRRSRDLRHRVALVPSGDRSFYLRISGLENLVFFGRMLGMRRRPAIARAGEMLMLVGLEEAAAVPVGVYSHGMQKRLSVARALLARPEVLLVDEATHDLDPEGARSVRELVRQAAGRGAAVIWTTQRVEEISAFADDVTLLRDGKVRFAGSVNQLVAHAVMRRYVLRLQGADAHSGLSEASVRDALGGMGAVHSARDGEPEHYVLSLADGVVLGDALVRLSAADIKIIACREERPVVEEAFLTLTEEGSS